MSRKFPASQGRTVLVEGDSQEPVSLIILGPKGGVLEAVKLTGQNAFDLGTELRALSMRTADDTA